MNKPGKLSSLFYALLAILFAGLTDGDPTSATDLVEGPLHKEPEREKASGGGSAEPGP
ncbi:hypothetical protein [Nonomuraea sp. NPDC048826]|uniref:hypothetical protein n=1 Tax=Nonomuraea sp. NPDC048826 TaxID=3364347 RepID=UPI00370F7F49